jgi:UDP-N-acetylmuramate--alanine ligase
MNIYFSGIGGVGIGPLAEIARDAGHFVAGSDTTKSLVTYQLEEKGVEIAYTQDGAFLDEINASHPLDWFIYTAAIPDTHPELVRARELGIRTGKRDELISEIIKTQNLKLIAVAGTHGKTTTTGMLVWALRELGIPVSYSVGSTITFGPSGRFDRDSQYFVYECDEFDRNFLHFSPYLSLITRVDYDHQDTYPTQGDYDAAFQQFIGNSQHVIMWQREVDHGLVPSPSTWVLNESEIEPYTLTGLHNRENATLVSKACEYLSIGTFDEVRRAINTFPGTARRFERLATNLYSDYGHHPTEIKATLEMARELNDHVTVVYQPHQNIRQHEIKDQYAGCFDAADKVYWLPTYLSREDPTLPILTPQELSHDVAQTRPVIYADLNDSLWQEIQSEIARGQLVVVMGAGTVDGWLRKELTL